MPLWLQCLLSILGVWRVTHLVVAERGPWGIFERLRRSVGKGMAGELLHCFYCLSVWVALPFAAMLPVDWRERTIAWLAFSGGAILLERATADPVEIRIEE